MSKITETKIISEVEKFSKMHALVLATNASTVQFQKSIRKLL